MTDQDHRWRIQECEFSVCKRIEDVKRYFGSRQLVIDPGIRAMIIEDGHQVGEVGPGTYTLQSLCSTLKFWKRKQSAAILTRQEDSVLKIKFRNLPTIEGLGVVAAIHVATQIDDVALFARNLMGARDTFTVNQLESTLKPILAQVLWESIGRHSITELTSPDVRETMDAAMEQSLTLTLRRYGIRFVAVQLFQLYHPEYNEHREEKGKIWLQNQDLENQEKQQEIASQQRLLELKQHEKNHELDVLEAHLNVDRKESELDISRRRIGIRNEMLAILRSKHGDTLEHKDQVAKLLHEYNKEKLIRQEEMDALVSLYEQNQEDRDSARELVIAKLNAERDSELAELRETLEHQIKLKRIDQEIELATQADKKENVLWKQECERARKETEQHHQQRLLQMKQQREELREQAITEREEEWDTLVHQKRMEQIKVDVELAELERQKRVQILAAELKDAELAARKRQSELELEISSNEDLDQMQRLKMIEDLNAETTAREHRMKIELENLQADSAAERELKRIEAMKHLSDEALISLANPENAALLADVKKAEATSGESEKVEIYKEAMDSQKEILKTALGHAAPAAPSGPPPVPAANQWHISVDGQSQGPYTDEQMRQYIAAGQITAQTNVWKASMGEHWLPASQVPEFSATFTSAPPPPPIG